MEIKQTTELQTKIYQDALNLRKEVFIREQNVPEELEIDELENECLHFVLYADDGTPIATSRVYPLADQQWKLQRVAVKKNKRKQHLGQLLLKHIEAIAKENHIASITLGAQVSSIGFYESLGYHVSSEEFDDAGIPHRQMEKNLETSAS
ncbi:GNAT family N-acetyltransferase [Vagococcus elongatus]|uniref:N-acetyltransferase domain-containing protein n=1 Tax=Vagococcus elongatus TaxID=180344 RepID=A0A430B1Q0_9ENTE|nr:GNAT family N-acetyltransferase [Vagococcus elongatus]RSU14267.1 hypothetical protein CBF29_02905 [Vagococcus elongatus]